MKISFATIEQVKRNIELYYHFIEIKKTYELLDKLTIKNQLDEMKGNE